jgi:iron complex transport system permease protein
VNLKIQSQAVESDQRFLVFNAALWSGALVLLVVTSLLIGPVLGPAESLAALVDPERHPLRISILLHIRLPRIFVTILVGAALGAAGGALQGLFRNPLADPAILGVSPTAALACQGVLFWGGATLSVWTLPTAACVGAILATSFLALLLGPKSASGRDLLLLGGIALSQVMSAMSALLLSLSVADYSRAQRLLAWMLGNLEGKSWGQVGISLMPVALGISMLTRQGRALDALTLGNATASSLGVDIHRTEKIVTLWSAVLSGITVALAGIVGFVGLLAPHFVRALGSSRHERVVPKSAYCGACLLVFADLVARSVIAPVELPVGVVTGALGAPLFAYLLYRRVRRQV